MTFRRLIIAMIVLLQTPQFLAARDDSCAAIVRGALAPFKLSVPPTNPVTKAVGPWIETMTANLPGLRWANQRALMLSNRPAEQNVFSRGLEVTDINYELFAPYADLIPRQGPVIFISNHRGMDDALIDGDWALRVRPDMKFVIGLNAAMLPDLHPYAFIVDNSESRSASSANTRFLRQVLSHLKSKNGQSIFWYPSDYVDLTTSWSGDVRPHPFQDGLDFVVKNSQATIVPVYHDSLNPRAYYQMGYLLRKVNPFLASALLPWALSQKSGATLKTYIGKPIPPEEWKAHASSKSRKELPQFLQQRVEELPQVIKGQMASPIEISSLSPLAPIANDYSPQVARQELESFGPDHFLVGSLSEPAGKLVVTQFFADEAPMLTRGVGIGRELTFRAVGEGTGQAIDLDALDLSAEEPRFQQMAVINTETNHVVAGYRFKRGITYTSQFYKHLPSELYQAPTMELSRAWVHPELQNGSMISTLWNGIGRILGNNLDVDQMVGSASMSSKEYPEEILQLTHYFLSNGPYKLETDNSAQPLNPPKFSALTEEQMKEILKDVRNIDDFEKIVRKRHPEGKGLPPLIPGYIKIGAKVFGTVVDPDFQNSLDFGILIRSKEIPGPYLRRFMGNEKYEEKVKRWNESPAQPD
jgi:putative hemolysin